MHNQAEYTSKNHNPNSNSPSEPEDSLWTPAKKDSSLWSKGKLKEHHEKHGIPDFGLEKSKDYSSMAREFGVKKSNDIVQTTNGAFIYRYQKSTDYVFVGTNSGRIKTFYIWDGREDTVIQILKEKGLLL